MQNAMDSREIAGSIVSSLVAYVRRAAGDEGLKRMLDLAGGSRSVDDLLDGAKWRTFDETVALAEAAEIVTGDTDIGRRAGEELFRNSMEGGLDNFIKASGDPATALVSLVAYGSKMSRGRAIEPVSVEEQEVVLEARTVGLPLHRFFCGVGPGYWALVPSLFGASGTVVEDQCQCRGADSCVYRVRWDRPVEITFDDRGEVERRIDTMIAGFERMQAMASELTRAETITTVLERIVDGADRAIVAPRFLVALVEDGIPVHVVGRGLLQDEADDAARRLLADAADATFGLPVVVELASHRQRHGILAALLPPGSAVGEFDHRLLGAYAGHATAAIEAVTARGLAVRNHGIVQALLDLARTVAAVASPEEVCDRLAQAVPHVTDCDIATVWRWDAAARSLQLQSWSGMADPPSVTGRITEDDVPGLGNIGQSRRATVIDVDTSSPFLVEELRAAGAQQAAIVPISARGELLGLATAAFIERRHADDELFQRLHGLADLAATALDNALLLEHMRHQALHDSLTGLPNRPLLEDRVEQAIRRAERTGGGLTIMFIDLDRFKNVNDTLGHRAGDELIRQVGSRLATCVRDADTLARMGGDEFVLLLPDTGDLASSSSVAEKLIGSLHEPFALQGHELYISCSIGVAAWPRHGRTYGELLQHADAAMYDAKAAGRNRYAFHSGPASRRRELLDLENRLHTAIERGELAVLYQPQVDLATMRVIGVEALVRWDHPELGRLGPDRFVPLAEESGVITRIDAWVRARAFAQARDWNAKGMPMRVAVNLSTADLRRVELVTEIEAAMDVAGIGPDLVELEITDRVALGENDLRPRLAELAGLGVRLAVDDFGVGSSVLGRLQHGPFHTLKIDRSLVDQIDEESRQAPIVQALVAMAHELGLNVVAEGVETATQGGVLRRYGCEIAQGFLFAKPIEALEVERLSVGVAASTGGRPGR